MEILVGVISGKSEGLEWGFHWYRLRGSQVSKERPGGPFDLLTGGSWVQKRNCRSLGYARDDKGEGSAAVGIGCWFSEPQVPRLRSPGFPVEIHGVDALHAPFFTESRTRGVFQCCVAGNPGRDDKGESGGAPWHWRVRSMTASRRA